MSAAKSGEVLGDGAEGVLEEVVAVRVVGELDPQPGAEVVEQRQAGLARTFPAADEGHVVRGVPGDARMVQEHQQLLLGVQYFVAVAVVQQIRVVREVGVVLREQLRQVGAVRRVLRGLGRDVHLADVGHPPQGPGGGVVPLVGLAHRAPVHVQRHRGERLRDRAGAQPLADLRPGRAVPALLLGHVAQDRALVLGALGGTGRLAGPGALGALGVTRGCPALARPGRRHAPLVVPVVVQVVEVGVQGVAQSLALGVLLRRVLVALVEQIGVQPFDRLVQVPGEDQMPVEEHRLDLLLLLRLRRALGVLVLLLLLVLRGPRLLLLLQEGHRALQREQRRGHGARPGRGSGAFARASYGARRTRLPLPCAVVLVCVHPSVPFTRSGRTVR